MKYQIRKAAKYTVFSSSEIAELDPEDFRNHENNPYEGNTEEEFIQYITQFDFDDTEGLSSETFDELLKIFDNPDMTEHYSTSQDYEESWFEVGEKNEKIRKTGGFDVHFSS
jgi:hypothetical protein